MVLVSPELASGRLALLSSHGRDVPARLGGRCARMRGWNDSASYDAGSFSFSFMRFIIITAMVAATTSTTRSTLAVVRAAVGCRLGSDLAGILPLRPQLKTWKH